MIWLPWESEGDETVVKWLSSRTWHTTLSLYIVLIYLFICVCVCFFLTQFRIVWDSMWTFKWDQHSSLPGSLWSRSSGDGAGWGRDSTKKVHPFITVYLSWNKQTCLQKDAEKGEIVCLYLFDCWNESNPAREAISQGSLILLTTLLVGSRWLVLGAHIGVCFWSCKLKFKGTTHLENIGELGAQSSLPRMWRQHKTTI